MKWKYWVLLTVAVLAGTSVRAGLYTGSSGNISVGIADGDANGVANTITVGGTAGAQISSMIVTINLSGGYNGDLYAVLSHDGASGAVLLNRIGRGTSYGGTILGYSTAGGTFTFGSTVDSSLLNNIHSYGGGAPSGTYAPDGRTIDPLSPRADFNSTPSGNALTSFNTIDPTGGWTIFFADMAQNGQASTLTGWSLEITAVPEPVNMALGIFGGIALVVIGARRRLVRDRVQRVRAATVEWINAV
jgi:hypothetical protein